VSMILLVGFYFSHRAFVGTGALVAVRTLINALGFHLQVSRIDRNGVSFRSGPLLHES